jgi:hypothetical protein
MGLEPTNRPVEVPRGANTVEWWPPWTVVLALVTMTQLQTWKGWPAVGRQIEQPEAGRGELLAAGRAEPSAMGTPEAPVQLSSWIFRSSRRGRWRAGPLGFLSGGSIFGELGDLTRGARFLEEVQEFGSGAGRS